MLTPTVTALVNELETYLTETNTITWWDIQPPEHETDGVVPVPETVTVFVEANNEQYDDIVDRLANISTTHDATSTPTVDVVQSGNDGYQIDILVE